MKPPATPDVPVPGPETYAELDRMARAGLARRTLALSPAVGLLALQDWLLHFSAAPGKYLELTDLALAQAEALREHLTEAALAAGEGAPAPLPKLPQDVRFKGAEWQQFPYNLMYQSFLMTQAWWDTATRGVVGVDPYHERVVNFGVRQWLDIFSPGNQFWTNPVVLRRTFEEGGANLSRGFENWLADFAHLATGEGPAGTENFVVGRDVGVTPGKVVLRNRVMELIQYSPLTDKVHPEPILILPAWIMKYYILDLSPRNSMIRYLVERGHTVFCVSWKNPGKPERDLSMEDYLDLGFHEALDAVNKIVPGAKVHATGYCLGGTLLTIAAAAMGRDRDERLASVTLFAAQTDFSEPGELGLFISESQLSMMEARMSEVGYLEGGQMAGAFQMLRSNDLLWSRVIHGYLMGDPQPINDLMAWNADVTRMPARMHSQYLRRLFLNNDLSDGRYQVGGRAISLRDIRLPVFMVGTVTDHVAPWRSVYKLHHLSSADITFALTSGGHNAGIVNPPGNPRRHYQLLERDADDPWMAPDEWQATAPHFQDSWWPAWQQWLAGLSGKPVRPPAIGAATIKPIGDAPGSYVMEK